MPELPEVQTTVNGLKSRIVGHTIADAWSDYGSQYFRGSETIKDRAYFVRFRKTVLRRKVVSVDRRAKNILINLSGGLTILVHMKMTGHLLYGKYRFEGKAAKDPWFPLEPQSLKDPYNRHVHFVLSFENGRQLALSDVRKFAKVAFGSTAELHKSEHLRTIGPEPLEKGFTAKSFSDRLDLRPEGKIKPVLMDQKILAGVGNIYADESLWRAGIHPLERIKNIPSAKRTALWKAIKKTLSRGIDFGGDSTSDYRNVAGEKGAFHEKHHAYQKTGSRCEKRGCGGTIRRITIGARSAHFCDRHQRLLSKHSKERHGRGH